MKYTLQPYKPVAILSLKMCLNISTLKTQLHNLQYYVFFKVCRPLSDPWTWITVVVSAMFYKLMCSLPCFPHICPKTLGALFVLLLSECLNWLCRTIGGPPSFFISKTTKSGDHGGETQSRDQRGYNIKIVHTIMQPKANSFQHMRTSCMLVWTFCSGLKLS